MFRNQYIAVSTDHAIACEDMQCVECCGLRVYAKAPLKVSHYASEHAEVAVIGCILDPLHPEATEVDIVERLARECMTREDFFVRSQPFCGRFVMLFRDVAGLVVTGDACHRRQILYGRVDGALVLTSSEMLFLHAFRTELQMSDLKREFIADPSFERTECSWYGEDAIDDRLSRLLPNHYLDVAALEPHRLPYTPAAGVTREPEILDYAVQMLRGTYHAAGRRYKIMQPLTAGWDSRVLLAASKNIASGIQYYLFERPGITDADVRVARQLCDELGLQFQAIRPSKLRDDFLSVFKPEHVLPRLGSKAENVQHHYDQRYAADTVNTNGNSAEVARCVYGYTRLPVTLDMVCMCTGFRRSQPFVAKALNAWYPSARRYAKENGLFLLDLFYWEQRMGVWGSLYPFEQDISNEEISPYNNRSLLNTLVHVTAKKRKAPDFSFYRQLAGALWPEVLSAPVNPDTTRMQKLINSNTFVKYVWYRLRRLRQRP